MNYFERVGHPPVRLEGTSAPRRILQLAQCTLKGNVIVLLSLVRNLCPQFGHFQVASRYPTQSHTAPYAIQNQKGDRGASHLVASPNRGTKSRNIATCTNSRKYRLRHDNPADTVALLQGYLKSSFPGCYGQSVSTVGRFTFRFNVPLAPNPAPTVRLPPELPALSPTFAKEPSRLQDGVVPIG